MACHRACSLVLPQQRFWWRDAPNATSHTASNLSTRKRALFSPLLPNLQLFPETEANTYYNISRLGPLSATLKVSVA